MYTVPSFKLIAVIKGHRSAEAGRIAGTLCRASQQRRQFSQNVERHQEATGLEFRGCMGLWGAFPQREQGKQRLAGRETAPARGLEKDDQQGELGRESGARAWCGLRRGLDSALEE